MGRRRREKALADALSRAALAGVSRGRQQTLLSVLSRIARRLLGLDARDAVRMIEERGPEATLRGLGRLARDVFAPRWREAMAPILEEVMDLAPVQTDRGNLPLSFDLQNRAMRDYFDGYMVRLSGEVTDTTVRRVTEAIREAQEEGLSVPETAERVRAKADDISASRANLIARQELQRSSKGAARIKAEQSGVVKTKTRYSAKDARVRPEHREIDGETVALGERYSNGEDYCGELDFACRCVDIFGVDMEAVRDGAA